jgi:hypothetical protein
MLKQLNTIFSKIKVKIAMILRPQVLFYTRLKYPIERLLISDRSYVRRKYRRNFNKDINLDNPKTFNEHISNILLEYNDPIAASCADKYEVRKYVESKVGRHILNDLYGVYSNVQDIKNDLPSFPDQFVLKAAHGCGWNYICKDKNELNWDILKHDLKHWLKSNFYYYQREVIYKDLKPRIVCEKYLEDDSGGLMDYKVHCFKGEPKIIVVILGRHDNMKANAYDLDWNFIDVSFTSYSPNDKNVIIERPRKFDELMEYSKKLSRDFNFVRVDFYIVKDEIIFGELTFTPGNGAFMFSDGGDAYLGKYFEA